MRLTTKFAKRSPFEKMVLRFSKILAVFRRRTLFVLRFRQMSFIYRIADFLFLFCRAMLPEKKPSVYTEKKCGKNCYQILLMLNHTGIMTEIAACVAIFSDVYHT